MMNDPQAGMMIEGSLLTGSGGLGTSSINL